MKDLRIWGGSASSFGRKLGLLDSVGTLALGEIARQVRNAQHFHSVQVMFKTSPIWESGLVSLSFGASDHPALLGKPEHTLAGDVGNTVRLAALRPGAN